MSAIGKLEQQSQTADALQHSGGDAHVDELHAATSTGLDHRKLIMWVFIASETIFFAALISAYLVYRGRTPLEEGLHHLNLAVASVNTFILLGSSLTMVLSLQAIGSGNKGRMMLLLGLTAVLGLVFLGGQAFEYNELLQNGVSPDTNLFGSTFFTLTGFHGAHVFVGVLWILSLILRARRGGITPDNHLAVELGGLYWHFVDLVWVVLFTLIYLI